MRSTVLTDEQAAAKRQTKKRKGRDAMAAETAIIGSRNSYSDSFQDVHDSII